MILRQKVPVNKTQSGQHGAGHGNKSEASIIQPQLELKQLKLIRTVGGKSRTEPSSFCPDVMNKVLTSPRVREKVKAQ